MCDQLRWDYLSCYGHPQPAHAEHRCAGRARRALHARLRAVARVRRLAHELLHRPLRAVARRVLERRAAQGRRDDARRLPAAARACRPRWSARRTCAPTREGMERLGIDPNSIIGVRVAECGFDPYERDDGLHARRPRRPLRSAARRATTTISTTRATPATTPGTTGPTPRDGRRQPARVRLGHAPCAQARARRARRTPRRPT